MCQRVEYKQIKVTKAEIVIFFSILFILPREKLTFIPRFLLFISHNNTRIQHTIFLTVMYCIFIAQTLSPLGGRHDEHEYINKVSLCECF